MKTSLIDLDLADVDGVLRWTEHCHGAEAHCMLDGRLLAKVLRARPAYIATKPKMKLVVSGLRVVKPAKEKSA